MLLAMAKDLRVILVKLADRTHNMRTIGSLPLEKQRRIAKETLDIYAPIANRLGVYTLKIELEELGFKTLYPYRYKVLQRSLRRAKGNQRQLLRKIESKLTKTLSDAKIAARVHAREKHLYSIYLKMQRKHAHLADIVDVYGVRVIVPDVDVTVLGRIRRSSRCRRFRTSSRSRASTAAHDAVRRTACRSGADPHRGDDVTAITQTHT
jgi:(p)ppGpp synthase/HD superfamily hydrolase